MKASYYCALLALAAVVSAPAADPPAPAALLLDDFRIVEGRVEKFDKLYRVTANGKTEFVAVVHVLHLGATRDEVYRYVTDRADTGTAAGRAKLAEWYLTVGEPARAAAEAKAAAELAPADAKAQELLKRCDAAVKAKTTVAAAPSGGRKSPELPAAGGPTPPTTSTPPAVAPEAANLFAARVQPILMNTCATCHARKDHPGTFKLDRVPEGYANAAAAAANLAAVSAQLSAADTAASPLLVKAVTAHGGAKQPPLSGRTHPAFRNLELWVYAAIGPPKAATGFGAAPPAEPAKLPPLKVAPAAPPQPAVPAAVAPKPAANTPGPLPTANPDDPFDPAVFNRRRNGNN